MDPKAIQFTVDEAWKNHVKDDTQTVQEKQSLVMMTEILTEFGKSGPEALGAKYQKEFEKAEKDADGGVTKEQFKNMVANVLS